VVFWSKEEQSLLFGAFAYGGVGVQVAIGWLSDQYGKTKFQMYIAKLTILVKNALSDYKFRVQNFGVRYFRSSIPHFSYPNNESQCPILLRSSTDSRCGYCK